MDGSVAAVRAYYRAIDEDDYELLAEALDPEFVHERPDQTLSGRDRFVRFMREERPQTDTTHPIEAIYVPLGPDGEAVSSEGASEVVARGRLLKADGSLITHFVDVFEIEGDRLGYLRTYTR